MVPADAVAPLGLLVERLPPAVAVVLGSRSDPPLPLSRWRVNGLLGELRTDELRFSARDTARVVAASGVELSPDDVDTLTARTEGWAAGVHLAALALRDHPDPAAFVRAFAGSDHNVTDYLASEVLTQLDAESLDCLLALATLDEFDADRCRALTGRHDSADRLEAFETANLFLVRVGTDTGTYRFHQLFRDVLRGWLSARDPDRVKALHAAASRWYEQHDDIARAVRHAIDGADADRAFALVRDHTASGYFGGGAGISSWISELGSEVLSARSDQLLDYIVVLLLAGWIDEAGRWLAYLDTLPPADPSPRFAARHTMAKAVWLGSPRGDPRGRHARRGCRATVGPRRGSLRRRSPTHAHPVVRLPGSAGRRSSRLSRRDRPVGTQPVDAAGHARGRDRGGRARVRQPTARRRAGWAGGRGGAATRGRAALRSLGCDAHARRHRGRGR